MADLILQSRTEAVQPSLWDRLVDDLPGIVSETDRQRADLAARIGAARVEAVLAGGARVIEADPGRSFAFECSMMDFHYATWGYRIEPTESGCTVTEWTEDLRPESALEFSQQISGVEDRTSHNRTLISGTLERLAAALE